MRHKIVIIGSGKVGTALQTGLSRAGYDVRVASKEQITEGASWADVIILAVPFSAVPDVARALELAHTIAGRSPLTLRAAKNVIDALAAGADPQAAVEPWERRSRHAPDVREGLAAFVERRRPQF